MRIRIIAGAVGALCSAILLGGCGGGDLDSASADDKSAPGAQQGEASLGGSVRLWTRAATPASVAQWSPVIKLSIVPAAAANLPDGRILFWSAEQRFGFSQRGSTYTTVFDPATQTATERLITETGHDMFCPGTTNLPDGTILITGGIDSEKSSLFDPFTNTWRRAANMNVPRGYQANTLTATGEVFTLGGSWSGGQGGKDGELWTADGGWRRLTGVPVAPALGESNEGPYRTDNHMWLFATADQRVFHAGPSARMNWITTRDNGSIAAAGTRGDDIYSMSGNAVLYDIGKILKVGGSSGYTDAPANANSYTIDLDEQATVRKLAPMAYARAFHNSVVLPNGQVVVIGGQTWAKNFDDNNSVMVPELWDPATRTFSKMPAMSVPRNYHSVALLMTDGRVVSSGGGLCGTGCSANHPDLQILTPPYLLNADGSAAARPTITQAPAQALLGSQITVNTNAAVASFVLMRMGSVTHTVNNDQRRVPVAHVSTSATSHTVTIPSNPGIALPGYYMLFALNSNGTPSVSRVLRVHGDGLPMVINPGAQSSYANTDVDVTITRNGAAGTFSATGLPQGLSIDPATGRVTGRAATAGSHRATISIAGNGGATSTDVTWTVSTNTSSGPANGQSSVAARYVRLEALSEINGNPWTSMAEFNVLDAAGAPMSRTGWTAQADSVETANENGSVANVLDGNANTHWHTQWSGGYSPPAPHTLIVDMKSSRPVGGVQVLPRTGGGNGTIAQFRLSTSIDGNTWTTHADGDFKQWATGNATAKTVLIGNLARGKAATQSGTGGGSAALAVDGSIGTGSTAITTSQANAWWQMDLGASHTLSMIRLWNRADCCAEQLAKFSVFVSPSDMSGRTYADLNADSSVWRYQVSGQAARELLIRGNARGRYLRVQRSDTGVLALSDVEAYGVANVQSAPVLKAQADVISDAGKAASLAISATDADGDAIRFSATGLPPGLAIDAATGRITGTPTTPGSSIVRITATDSTGLSSTGSFTWLVVEPNPFTGIVTAPPAAAGSPIGLTLPGTPNGITQYSWDFGDGTAPTAFSTSLGVNHQYQTGGLYTVTVTARTSSGATQTYSFTQAVYAPANGARRPVASTNIAYEARGNGRVWVVNQDSDSVSVIDAATRQRVKEIPVGIRPRAVAIANDGNIWVTNKGSATISVISPSTLAITRTIALPRASQPFGLVFSPVDGSAWVALEAGGKVLKLASANGSQLGAIDVGSTPRHLSMTADGTRLLVSRFISPPLPGESTASVQDQSAGADRGGEVVVVRTANASVERTVVLKVSKRADSTVQGRGVPNYLGAAVIRPDGSDAWVPSKQDNVQRGLVRDGKPLDFQNSVRAIVSRIDLTSLAEDHERRGDLDNSGVGSAAVFDPTGSYLFVALETSRHVAVVNSWSGQEIFRFDVGRAPEGLAISPDGKTLFVNNFMDRTVGIHDLGAMVTNGLYDVKALATVAAVGTEKLAADVLRGKQFFYDARDPRLARDAYLSCASCHNDGDTDGRTWDFTGFGEGLRNTIPLRGRAGMGHGALHWSANFDELQDFEGQIRDFAQGTGLMTDAQFNAGTRRLPLGDRKTGVSADLDALAAYMTSLSTFDASPYRNASGSLTSDAAAGRTLFAQKGCTTCHAGARLTDSGSGVVRDIGTIKATSGTRLGSTLTGIDTPTLLDAWASAPYLHDGSAATIDAAIRAHASLALTNAEVGQLAAYVRQIGTDALPTVTRSLRYLRLQALTEIRGNPWSSMAEFNVLDGNGNALSRSGWTATADSVETAGENGQAGNVLDGNANTIWHTEWSRRTVALPHTLTVDMRANRTVSAIRYLPRPGGTNGTIGQFRLYGSTDGSTWTLIGDGDFGTMGAAAAEKTVQIR